MGRSLSRAGRGWLAAPGAGGAPAALGSVQTLYSLSRHNQWLWRDPFAMSLQLPLERPGNLLRSPQIHFPLCCPVRIPPPKPRSGSDLPQSLECLWDGKSLVSHLCRPPEVASWSRSPRDPLQLPAGSAPCRVAAAAPHLGAAAQLQCCALGLSPGKIPPWAEVQQE